MSDDLDDDFQTVPITGLAAGKFPLGQVQIAADTAYELDRAFVEACLRRHAAGDWGEADPDTARGNEQAMRGDREFPIVSNYPVGDRLLQIATQPDGSVTSIVLYDAAQSSASDAWELLPALELVRSTLKLRHIDQASDDDVEEALSIADAAIVQASKLRG
jgi:hypothetical protein